MNTFGKLKIPNKDTSNRIIKQKIKEGIYEGWNDPKLVIIRGLLRKGMSIDGLINFISDTGFTNIQSSCLNKNGNKVINSEEKMWIINKKFIDPISSRYTFLKNNHFKSIHIINKDDSSLLKEQMWTKVRRYKKFE